MEQSELLKMTKTDIAKFLINNNKLLPSAKNEKDNPWYKELTPIQIYRLTLECAEAMKLNMEPEPLYYILNDAKNIGVSAIAGSGKTTTTAFRLFRQIVLSGINPKKMCILTFTKESEKDIIKKFKYIRNTCNPVLKRYGIFLEDGMEPYIKTLNSLTYNIVLEFPEYFGKKPKNYIISETVSYIKMEETVMILAEQFNLSVSDQLIKDLVRLYQIQIESYLTYEEISKQWEISRNGITPQQLKTIYKTYRMKLDVLDVYHQAETSKMVVDKCESNPDFAKKVGSIYEYIVVDEAQDITENTRRLLGYLINTKNRSCIIGDDDQRIYSFRGSLNIRLIDLFKEFNSSEICTLSLNRRCREEILNFSRLVLDEIPNRYPMQIRANKTGGSVNIFHYKEGEDVYGILCDKFKNTDVTELKSVCIGYRNNMTGFILSNLFLERGIPYIIKDNYKPGNDYLSKALYGICNMLDLPTNPKLVSENLYKVTNLTRKPISLEKVKEVIPLTTLRKYYGKENITIKDLTNDTLLQLYVEEIFKLENVSYFYDIDFTKYFGLKPSKSIYNLSNDLTILKKASQDLRGDNIFFEALPLKQIIEIIWPMFFRYYWAFTRKAKSFPEELEKVIYSDFTRSDFNYKEYLINKEKQMSEVAKLANRGYGVTLSTFHSMKGLEYDDVILIDLEDEVFPSIRVSEEMSQEEIEALLAEELQLFYVATTRPRNSLTMYWNSEKVSVFYPLVQKYEQLVLNHNQQYQQFNGTGKKNLILDKVNLIDYTVANASRFNIEDIKEQSSDLINLNLDLTSNIDLDLISGIDLDLTNDVDLDLNNDTDLNNDINLDLNVANNNSEDLAFNFSQASQFTDTVGDLTPNSSTTLLNNISVEDLTLNNKQVKTLSNIIEEPEPEQLQNSSNSEVSGFLNVAGGQELQAIMGVLFNIPQ